LKARGSLVRPTRAKLAQNILVSNVMNIKRDDSATHIREPPTSPPAGGDACRTAADRDARHSNHAQNSVSLLSQGIKETAHLDC